MLREEIRNNEQKREKTKFYKFYKHITMKRKLVVVCGDEREEIVINGNLPLNIAQNIACQLFPKTDKAIEWSFEDIINSK